LTGDIDSVKADGRQTSAHVTSLSGKLGEVQKIQEQQTGEGNHGNMVGNIYVFGLE
jgi:hypothetical protein